MPFPENDSRTELTSAVAYLQQLLCVLGQSRTKNQANLALSTYIQAVEPINQTLAQQLDRDTVAQLGHDVNPFIFRMQLQTELPNNTKGGFPALVNDLSQLARLVWQSVPEMLYPDPQDSEKARITFASINNTFKHLQTLQQITQNLWLPEGNIQHNYLIAPDFPRLNFPAGSFFRLLFNLTRNAQKAIRSSSTQTTGCIELRAGLAEGWPIIRISDTGCGFGPFFQQIGFTSQEPTIPLRKILAQAAAPVSGFAQTGGAGTGQGLRAVATLAPVCGLSVHVVNPQLTNNTQIILSPPYL